MGEHCNSVSESGMSVPLLTTAATAHTASTPLQALNAFTFGHSQTVTFGADPPPQTRSTNHQ